MSLEEAIGEIFIFLVLGLIGFLISVLIMRWIFSINTIVKLLSQIRDDVKKLTQSTVIKPQSDKKPDGGS